MIEELENTEQSQAGWVKSAATFFRGKWWLWLIIAYVIISLFSGNTDSGWQKFNFPEDHFSIHFPGSPRVEEMEFPAAIKVRVYQAIRKNDTLYQVGVTNFPWEFKTTENVLIRA